MMAAILNTAIVDSDTLLSPLRLTQKHSHSTLTLIQPNSIWLICWWQPSWILPSWIQPFCTKKLHSFILTHLDDGSHLEFCHVGFRHCHLGFKHLVIFSQVHSKTLSLHSDTDSNYFNLINLMMAAIMYSAILVSVFFHKTLTQTNSIWFKLIHSYSTWWCQPSWILQCCIQPFWTKKLLHSFILTHLDDVSHLEICLPGFNHFEEKKNFTHSFWLILMMAAILNSAMLDLDTAILDSDTCYLLSDSLKNNLTPLWLWLKLIQSDSNSFILTQLDDVSHLEFCHLGFNHLEQKKTSLIHSGSSWWWQPSWILPCWI